MAYFSAKPEPFTIDGVAVDRDALDYSPEDKFEPLVGRTVMAVHGDGGQTHAAELLFTCSDGETLGWHAEGDCCASAYFTEIDNIEALIGSPVLRVETTGTSDRADDDTHDVEWIRLHTAKGTATIELRTDHNGYYCGFAVFDGVVDLPADAEVIAGGCVVHDDCRTNAALAAACAKGV